MEKQEIRFFDSTKFLTEDELVQKRWEILQEQAELRELIRKGSDKKVLSEERKVIALAIVVWAAILSTIIIFL